MTELLWVKGEFQGSRPQVTIRDKKPCFRVTMSGRSLFTHYDIFQDENLSGRLRGGEPVRMAIQQMRDGTYWMEALFSANLTCKPQKRTLAGAMDFLYPVGGLCLGGLLLANGGEILGMLLGSMCALFLFGMLIDRVEQSEQNNLARVVAGFLNLSPEAALPIESVIHYAPPGPPWEPLPGPAEEKIDAPHIDTSIQAMADMAPASGQATLSHESPPSPQTGVHMDPPAKVGRWGFFDSLAFSQDMAAALSAGETDIRKIYDTILTDQPETKSKPLADSRPRGTPAVPGSGKEIDQGLGLLESLALSLEMKDQVEAGQTDINRIYGEMHSEASPHREQTTIRQLPFGSVFEGRATDVWAEFLSSNRSKSCTEYHFTCNGRELTFQLESEPVMSPQVNGLHPFFLAEGDRVRVHAADNGRTVKALRNLEDGCAYSFGLFGNTSFV